MHASDDWLRSLSAPRRNHFFTGKMMGVAQFDREQRYEMGKRWLLNRTTLGAGILCGLEVRVDSNRISVTSGVAVDPLGREIIVARAVKDFDPFATRAGPCCDDTPGPLEPGDHFVCLSYRECMADQQPAPYAAECPGEPDCQPDTTVETFTLSLRPAVDGKPFPCASWTAAVEGGASPGALELRKRLDAQLRSTCAAGIDTCVPLRRVRVAKDGDAWTLADPPDAAKATDPRVRIYSQEQLLDMILCLADKVIDCCGGDGPTPPVEPGKETLVVHDLVIGRDDALDAQRGVLSPLKRTTGANPAYVLASSDAAIIAVAFNKAVDLDTLVPATAADSPRSIALTVPDPGGGADLALPLTVMILPLDPTTMILRLGAGDDLIVDHRVGGRKGWPPGRYTLRLGGHDDPAATPGAEIAIKSRANAGGTALTLDGKYTGTLPSGDGTPGDDDFVFVFDLVDALLPTEISIDGHPGVQTNRGTWTWSANPLYVALTFNVALDPPSLAGALDVTGDGMHIQLLKDPELAAPAVVRFAVQVDQPADPAHNNRVAVALHKGRLRSTDGRMLDDDLEIGILVTA